jgi:hypothetical protein
MRRAQAEWRQRGPSVKFHNTVVFIRSSPQRREALKRCLPVGEDQANGGEFTLEFTMMRNFVTLQIRGPGLYGFKLISLSECSDSLYVPCQAITGMPRHARYPARHLWGAFIYLRWCSLLSASSLLVFSLYLSSTSSPYLFPAIQLSTRLSITRATS